MKGVLDFLWSKVSPTYFSIPGIVWDHCSKGTENIVHITECDMRVDYFLTKVRLS